MESVHSAPAAQANPAARRAAAGLGLCTAAVLFLAGCASPAPPPPVDSDPSLLSSTWVNAGATPPAPATAAPAPVPAPPATTLGGGVTAVGGTVASKPANGQYDLGWPRVFVAGGYTNRLFAPQTESFTGMVLVARAAVSMQSATMQDPVFGVLNLKALVHVDKVERTVHFEDVQIVDANFPSAPTQKAAYTAVWLPLLKEHLRSVALDRVVADLAILQQEQKADAIPVQNPVPAFVFATAPTMLVQVDGKPYYFEVKDTKVARILNTRAFIGQVPSGQLYLHLWDGFVTATSLNGAWMVTNDVPRGVKKALDEATKAQAVDLLAGQPNPQTGKPPSLQTTPLPTILVVTQATELIVFNGPADWSPIAGTDLLYVTNTIANVFKNLVDQQTYVLASGRWFKSAAFSGPWSYVPGQDLPKDFAKIPVTSPKENVLASVPGTPQAQQALIENQIPQMAKVDRLATQMPAPVFDGSPRLKDIAGTPLAYVENSTIPILRVETNSWYAVQNAVWFTAPAVTGPWTVATNVPAVIYSIPPSSPLYYVTFVRVYSYNPAYVWVGYTPGYYGTVVSQDNLLVYGTGYAYAPWVGNVWIAPPVTYGYAASLAWTPWAGWGYGFASGWAWAAGWDYWCAAPCAPYWGPYYGWCSGAYYNTYGGVTAWGPGGWAATTGNVYSQWGNWSSTWRGGEGYNAYTGNAGAYQYGHAYNSVTGTMAAGERGAVGNVYTGNYAEGGRGAAYNPRTGMTAQGGRYTVGNAYTGRQATLGSGSVYNPRTGQTTTAQGIHGANGGVYDVNGHTFATADGHVYQQSASGGWQRYTPSGNWQGVQSLDENRSLSQSFNAQSLGDQRANSWASHGWQDGGWGGGDRSWGGGGWGGGDRSWGGGGFGGFRGGGFGGFRR